MNTSLFRKAGLTAMVAMLATPFAVQAESTVATGAGALNTAARVDFQITIPRFLSLQVGALGASIDLITFTLTPAQAQAPGTPVAGTGGTPGPGAVTARVVSNGGAVGLVAATGGALSNGAGGTINWSEITTASSNASLPAPVLTNATSASVTVPATAGVANQTATWTYAYQNSAIVPAGTYGGVNVNNGRVTYTASIP